jgi:hypothetical protein
MDTGKEANRRGPFESETEHVSNKRGLCDSCNFSVDSRLSYQTILKFCELHMESNPGHKASPPEKSR